MATIADLDAPPLPSVHPYRLTCGVRVLTVFPRHPRGENGESTRSRRRTLTLWFSSDRWGRPLPIGSASGSPCSSTALEPIESRLLWDVHYVARQPEVVYPEGLFDR
jgi:hypothetical protein